MTCSYDFVAARIAIERLMNLRLTLRYLGVPISERVFMFGDNKSVVDSSNIPHGKFSKRHNALSYHRVREAIASKIVAFTFIPGTINPSEILSKHWNYSQIWDVLKPILLWEGDTADLI